MTCGRSVHYVTCQLFSAFCCWEQINMVAPWGGQIRNEKRTPSCCIIIDRSTTQSLLANDDDDDDRFYTALFSAFEQTHRAILRFRADSLRSHVILHEWLAFYSAFFKYSPKWCTFSACMAGATWNCCHLGRFVYTIQPCTMSLYAKPHA